MSATKTKKAAKPKPQLKNLDEFFGLVDSEVQGNLFVQDIPIENLAPFKGHPFRLYEGERLEDMVASIKANGVLVPVTARKLTADTETDETAATDTDDLLETLTGHNRINAARIAGLTTVPVIVLEDISDAEAMAYVVETNLMQRSFADMSHSEKAAVIAMHYDKMFSQGKRNDVLEHLKVLENPDYKPNTASDTNEPETGQRSDERIAAMYSLSRNTVARYLRINQLIAPLKIMLDNGKLILGVAVELSFLTEQEQTWLGSCLEEGFTVNPAKAAVLRQHSKDGTLDGETMKQILTGQTAVTENKPRKVNVRSELFNRFFTPEQSAKEVEVIVEEALLLYFNGKEGNV
jgi:ParB family chromosome partitioning protein